MANRTLSRSASGVEDEDEAETRKGPWTPEEDEQLMEYIRLHGEGRWSFLAKSAGLKRTGRSCRLRWSNSLRPDLKRSKITPEEERLIIELHGRWGNRWSHIARSLPGRTDNEIKNYCRTRMKGKLNLQVESGGGGDGGMDVDDRVDFERSTGPYCPPTSFHRSPDHDSAQPSTSFLTQNTKEVAVQTNKTPNVQYDISAQIIPNDEANHDECELQGESQHGPSQITDDGQPGAASHQDLEHSENQVFENSLPYNFLVGSPASLLYSSDFCADGATQDGRTPEAFSDREAYLSRYSDVLWQMDEEDDCFNGSKQSSVSK